MNRAFRISAAHTLTELLLAIVVIGAITAAGIPAISRLYESSSTAKNLANAKNIERISAALASLGVAHVIPDSMGGVEATARLFREGVVIPDGPMAGEIFILGGLSDDSIAELPKYLRVQYDMVELRLVMTDHRGTWMDGLPGYEQFCWLRQAPPPRIRDMLATALHFISEESLKKVRT